MGGKAIAINSADKGMGLNLAYETVGPAAVEWRLKPVKTTERSRAGGRTH